MSHRSLSLCLLLADQRVGTVIPNSIVVVVVAVAVAVTVVELGRQERFSDTVVVLVHETRAAEGREKTIS